MRKGNLDEANSVSTKISTAIATHNSVSFRNQNACSGAKKLWNNVCSVTSKNKKLNAINCAPSITADLLNSHYSAQSTDLNYVATDATDTKKVCLFKL
jgi:hypothetical protein